MFSQVSRDKTVQEKDTVKQESQELCDTVKGQATVQQQATVQETDTIR